MESAVIGVYNIFRMMKISPRASLATVPFFILHYGLFMFVHLIFISLFAGFQSQPLINSPVSLSLALLSLFISHGISYLTNFIGRQEYQHRTVKEQMFTPYPRVVVMHLTILLGAFLSFAIGQPFVLLLLLIALKITIDYFAHIKEHLTNAQLSNHQAIRPKSSQTWLTPN